MRRLPILAMVAVLACGDSTAPGVELQGTWTLTAVNGVAPPYVYYREVLEGEERIFALDSARLEFRTRNRVYDIRALNFRRGFLDTLVTAYSVSGTTLILTRPATPGVPGWTDTAVIGKDVITVRVRRLPGDADTILALTYRAAP